MEKTTVLNSVSGVVGALFRPTVFKVQQKEVASEDKSLQTAAMMKVALPSSLSVQPP